MAETSEVSTSTPNELLAVGRRHLAVRDYNVAASTLAKACEALAKEHGDTADQCAEAYLWYGKALLGLSREESGVLGDGVPSSVNADEDEENEDEQQGEEEPEGSPPAEAETESKMLEKSEAQSTTKEDEPGSSTNTEVTEEPGTSNGDGNDDESALNMENEEDVDNLQLAWEMLDLARSIFNRRVSGSPSNTARAFLAEVHLALGEVALESEAYDKAVSDMQSCLDIQKELYRGDDRRIAETHYQIGKQKPKRPFELLADSKMEIAVLQKQILEEEYENKKRQWAFEEEERQEEKANKKVKRAFEEEERQHRREMRALEKELLLKKINQ